MRLCVCSFYVFLLLRCFLLLAQQAHDNFDNTFEAFHLFLNCASHTSIDEAHGATNIYRLASPACEYFRKSCSEVERCAVGEEWCAERLTWCDSLCPYQPQNHGPCETEQNHTFGIAYTSEPSGTEDAASDVDVVRNSVIFGPLSWSRTLISVRGAFGRGTETSIGACDASPFVVEAAIVSCWCSVLMVRMTPPKLAGARTYPTRLPSFVRNWTSDIDK